MDNPYQPPSPTADLADATRPDPALAGPTTSKAPRWLAVLLAFLMGMQLLGLGLYILGRPRRAAMWLGIGLGFWVLAIAGVRLGLPVLLAVAFCCLVVAFIGSLVSTGRASFGERLSTWKAIGAAAVVLATGTVVAAAQRRFLTEAFQIPAGAMMPTMLVGDHIMVAKGSRAEPGDVIVFKYPADPEVDYVKRVMARGGETIEVRAGVVLVNGKELSQTRLSEPCPPPPQDMGSPSSSCEVLEEQNDGHRYRIQHDGSPNSFGPVKVPAGNLFVMGDNRNNSNDSRMWGTVPLDLVKGRARFVWWSRLGDEWRWGRIGKTID